MVQRVACWIPGGLAVAQEDQRMFSRGVFLRVLHTLIFYSEMSVWFTNLTIDVSWYIRSQKSLYQSPPKTRYHTLGSYRSYSNPIQDPIDIYRKGPQLDERLTSDALHPRCQGLHRVWRRSRFDLFKDLRDVVVEGHQMHSFGMRQAYSPSSVHDFWGNGKLDHLVMTVTVRHGKIPTMLLINR